MQLTLAQARELKGWSMEELAERAGMAKTTLWRLETGKTEPLLSTAYRLEDVLGVKRGTVIFPAAVGAAE